jgi:type IX secretion system PorP/SprF family membrane protein
MKTGRIRFILVLWGTFSFAQQESSFSHYMFNHQAINPGYAGARNLSSFTSVIRSQWSGIEGAPITQTLSFNTPITSKNLGFGLSVLNDKIGPTSNTSIDVDLAYHLRLNEKGHRLSIGVKAGAINYNLNPALLNTSTPNDPTFALALDRKIIPTIGFGAYFYTPRFYFGLSIPRLIDNNDFGLEKHAYAFAGGLVPLNETFMLKPSLMLKQSRSIVAMDASLLGIFNERFWFGVQVRNGLTGEELKQLNNVGTTAMFGVNIGKRFSLGYSYGFPSSLFNKGINMSTHELMLRFDLTTKSEGYLLSPRFF